MGELGGACTELGLAVQSVHLFLIMFAGLSAPPQSLFPHLSTGNLNIFNIIFPQLFCSHLPMPTTLHFTNEMNVIALTSEKV